MSQPPSTQSTPEALLHPGFPPREVVEVLARLKERGFAAYLVGGSIRDPLLGKPAKDFDIATSALAEQVVRLFRKVIPTGIKHGTVTVLTRSMKLEVTTFRGEGEYVDGRRPEEVFFLDNVVDDLARRDFTMNAMAFDPVDRQFVDPFGGEADLRARLIRCVGDPNRRFAEDGLRPLRAVRFAAVLGFDIEPATLAAIPGTLDTFGKVAQERVREELVKLLCGAQPALGCALLQSTGLLARILPELSPRADAASADARSASLELVFDRVTRCPPEADLRLAALLGDVAPEPATASRVATRVLERLRMPRKSIELITRLVAERDFAATGYPDDVSLRRAIARAGRDLMEPLLALAAADAAARDDGQAARSIEVLGARTRAILGTNPPLTPGELALDGRRIMELLGAGPGPRVGLAMRFLLDRVLEDPARNQPPILEALLLEWASSLEGGHGT